MTTRQIIPINRRGNALTLQRKPGSTVEIIPSPDPIALFICIPAWTRPYVDLAVKYTIPSVIEALNHRERRGPVTFLIHTDEPVAMIQTIKGYDCHLFNVKINPSLRDANWVAFKDAHRKSLAHTPQGAVCVLLNSDIVVSNETFRVVDRIFKHPEKRVIASVGIRTLVDRRFPKGIPPIGVGAKELNSWVWKNKHPITRELVWRTGRSLHPTVMFFENEGNVAMHCFHLTPMFIKMDERKLAFEGTIDDDVLYQYSDDEIFVIKDLECSFAELSPAHKHHQHGAEPMTVESVVSFGKKRFRPSHVRNFKHQIAVMGNPVVDPVAVEIFERLNADSVLRS